MDSKGEGIALALGRTELTIRQLVNTPKNGMFEKYKTMGE